MGASLKSLQYMEDNHLKHRYKWCLYWIGPFIPLIVTSDLENIKFISKLPGGELANSIGLKNTS